MTVAIIEKIHFLRAIIMIFVIILIDHMCTYTIYNDSNFILQLILSKESIYALVQHLTLFYFNYQNNEIYVTLTRNNILRFDENFLSSEDHAVQVKLKIWLRNEGENMLSTHYIIFAYVSCKNIEYWIYILKWCWSQQIRFFRIVAGEIILFLMTIWINLIYFSLWTFQSFLYIFYSYRKAWHFYDWKNKELNLRSLA